MAKEVYGPPSSSNSSIVSNSNNVLKPFVGEFVRVVSLSGIKEYTMFQNSIAEQNYYLSMVYAEVEEVLKRYEKYVGYKDIDEIKEELVEMLREICELSQEMRSTSDSLIE